MPPKPPRHLQTDAVHAGLRPDRVTGAIAPAIHPSTTFERDADGGYRRGYEYTRSGNPNRGALETALAALEGGVDAVAFASGTAATLAVFHAVGGHVVAGDDAYHGTVRQLRQVVSEWGVTVTFVDATDAGAVSGALRPDTRLIWLESPGNPMLTICDIAAIAGVARGHGVTFACDNTFATPVLQNPLALGADLVVHSTTKYLGGHSDLCGGAVIGASDSPVLQRVRAFQSAGGAIPAPFDCWLLRRSLATLPLRMQAHCEHALRVARFLDGHPGVERVFYPGLPGHPGHALAGQQMRGFGGMLAFTVKGGKAAAMQAAARVALITRATSLGGVESLIEHRASIEGPDTKAPDNLLRMSVGLEHPDDLIADLDQALAVQD